jgi:ArsR family transcriptional regulator, arsenate/arsenite/antimonite-responsive transcriptional repressor
MIESDLECCPPEPEVASPSDQDDEVAVLAKALGHPMRVRILRILLGQEACFCGELVELLPLAQATVSQHLKVLKEAGLIRGEIEGPRVCYCANRERVRALAGLIDLLAETPALVLEGQRDGERSGRAPDRAARG